MTRAQLAMTLPKAYETLERVLDTVPKNLVRNRSIDFTGGPVSVCDLIAYQIGWGKFVINWYETGLTGKTPEMPCEGLGWDYTILAQRFYKEYENKDFKHLRVELCEVVEKILIIILETSSQGKLDTLRNWDWCTLASGKEWPLAKWIQVNTVAPYTRATKLIRQFMKT